MVVREKNGWKNHTVCHIHTMSMLAVWNFSVDLPSDFGQIESHSNWLAHNIFCKNKSKMAVLFVLDIVLYCEAAARIQKNVNYWCKCCRKLTLLFEWK